MSESVLAVLSSSEADSGQNHDAPAGDAGSPAPDTGSAGAGAEGSRAADSGVAADGAQADDQSGSAAGAGANGKLVPLAALHESREKIRALTTQIDELKKQPQLSAEDAELLKELKAQRAEAKAPKDPDFLEDPKGYIDAKERRASEALKKLQDAETEFRTERQQQEQMGALMTAISTHEAAFAEKTPDYRDALTHVRSVRSQQLKLLYPQATDAQILQAIGREELGAAHQIIQAGGNPADFAYQYAKTLGYAPKAKQQQVTDIAAAAAAATNGAKPDKDAVRTLGGGGGADAEGGDEDQMPEFTAALKERFTRKRK